MTSALKAALFSSSALIALLVSWQVLSASHHSSALDILSYSMWVLPLFVLMAMLNVIAVLAGRMRSRSPVLSGAAAVCRGRWDGLIDYSGGGRGNLWPTRIAPGLCAENTQQ